MARRARPGLLRTGDILVDVQDLSFIDSSMTEVLVHPLLVASQPRLVRLIDSFDRRALDIVRPLTVQSALRPAGHR
jgi:hypothetical protein